MDIDSSASDPWRIRTPFAHRFVIFDNGLVSSSGRVFVKPRNSPKIPSPSKII